MYFNCIFQLLVFQLLYNTAALIPITNKKKLEVNQTVTDNVSFYRTLLEMTRH